MHLGLVHHAPGSHQLTVKAQDAAGNSTVSAPISFTVLPPNRAPSLGPVTTTHTTLDEGLNVLVHLSL